MLLFVDHPGNSKGLQHLNLSPPASPPNPMCHPPVCCYTPRLAIFLLLPYPTALLYRMKLSAGATKVAQRHPNLKPEREILKLKKKKKMSCRDFQIIPVFLCLLVSLLHTGLPSFDLSQGTTRKKRYRCSVQIPVVMGCTSRQACTEFISVPAALTALSYSGSVSSAMDHMLRCLAYYPCACDFMCMETHAIVKDTNLCKKGVLS